MPPELGLQTKSTTVRNGAYRHEFPEKGKESSKMEIKPMKKEGGVAFLNIKCPSTLANLSTQYSHIIKDIKVMIREKMCLWTDGQIGADLIDTQTYLVRGTNA